MKILISAGHNPSTDSGAVGQGQREADDNVRMADRVVLYLRSWGIETIYMPNDVGDLSAEIRWANANVKDDANSFAVQIHRNAGGGTGNEVWSTPYKNQMQFAESILKAMTEITGLPSRGVRDVKKFSPLGWVLNLNAQSVLIESRFIDRDSITDTDDMLDAYSIACGIADFLKVKRGLSLEQAQIKASNDAAVAQAAAKAEADRIAKLAEQARIDAENALQAKLKADAEAKRLADEAKKAADDKIAADKAKAEADKLLKDAAHANDHNFISVLKALWNLILTFMSGKGKQ